jgi:hypothetical protein
MSFRRTASGLSNSCLFHGVDFVVYLEGGHSFSRDEVDRGHYTNATQDIRFWQAIFYIYRPQKRYKFCSVGSKAIVSSIAKDISDGAISNSIAAMDRDFDHISGKLLTSDNVIYTNGYSWENDAWNEIALSEAFCTLSGACRTGIHAESKVINESYADFSSCLRGCTRMDAILSQHGNSFYCRTSYVRYVRIEPNGRPMINRQQLRSSMTKVRIECGRPIVRKNPVSVSPLLDCFGHLFAEYAYRVLAYLLEKIRKCSKVPKDYATGMVVEKFGQLLKAGMLTGLKTHYDSEFSRVAR